MDRLIARHRKLRASNRLTPETSHAMKSRMDKARSAPRRSDGTPVARDEAARARKRHVDRTRESRDAAARSQKRRVDGTREPDVAARPQKRRVDGTHEARDVSKTPCRWRARARSGRAVPKTPRRWHARVSAEDAMSRKRRVDGTRENAGAREMRREVTPPPGRGAVDTELALRKLFYWPGVAYLPGDSAETPNMRERRHCRMRLIARRTG